MMKRNRLMPLAFTAIASLALAGCGSAGGASDGETTLVLGHAGSDTDPRQDAAMQLKEIIETETDGRITVEVHGNSTLGTWEQMVEGLQMDSVDIVIESLLSVEAYTDLASVETAPFLYDSPEQFFEVWEGDLGNEIKSEITEDSGYAMLGNMYRGPRHLSSKTPVKSLDDLQGKTIRTPSAQTMVKTWQSLGARAEALPWDEVYSALEQGVIDGQENPLDVAVFNALDEVSPEITMTSHMYANYHFIMWDEALAGMPQDDQTIIRDAAKEVGQDYTENTASLQEQYVKDLEEKGVSFHELEDRKKWVAAVQPVVDGLPNRVQEWVKEIKK